MDSMGYDVAIFLIITFLFMVGSMTGWVIELFFRRFISTKNPGRKWINPGFLTGPCIPLYGFGLIGLFGMSLLPYVGQDYFGQITPGRLVIAILAMGAMMTLIEYIAGLVFILHLKIKLWDYSDEKFNIQGIICLKFSIIWTILAAVYYFFIQKYVLRLIDWFSDNIAFTFVVGMFYGILLTDLCYSFNIVGKVRRFAVQNDIVVKYEALKEEIRLDTDRIRKKGRFLLALNTDGLLSDKMEASMEKIRFVRGQRTGGKDKR